MQAQFSIDDKLQERLRRYGITQKVLSYTARRALEEWVNRQEGKDKKLHTEKLIANKKTLKPIIQDMIDSGDLELPSK